MFQASYALSALSSVGGGWFLVAVFVIDFGCDYFKWLSIDVHVHSFLLSMCSPSSPLVSFILATFTMEMEGTPMKVEFSLVYQHFSLFLRYY